MVPNLGVKHWLRRPSLWICLIGIMLSAVPVSKFGKALYYESSAVQSILVFFIIAPAVSAAMAWEASRFRLLVRMGRKSVSRIYVNRMLAWSLIFPLGYVLANLSQSTDSVLFGSSIFWVMLAYSAIVGICWTLVGSVLGFSFKPLISVSASGALAYSWYAVTPAISPGALRRITGDFLACCSLDTTLDVNAVGTAIAGIIGFTLTIASAAALLRTRSKFCMLFFFLGLISLLGSFVWARQLTEFGLAQRDPRQFVCSSNVCAWPEVPRENILLNIQARDAFSKISPIEWKDFSERPVMWGDFSEDHLSLSSQSTVEGIVGEFVDQAGSAELIRSNAKICGLPAKDLGITLSGLPWERTRQVSVGDVVQRIEQSVCRVSN
ncbi:hypothetical protein GWO63_006530 [Corynebacterium macginleyi]|uniref:ABC transporter permease n=1 Tax=Corynebacterium macginleyi TaxID=38290 RepID=A0ABS1Y6B4_9CORY|nr:hypothetical protein [Corynebacterium macginleyi]MBK4151233.1 hypothetical protein [Corynebacterium macginleyi]MBK4168269.1 hypothetical protein [Corynebacterium macginleyi]MBM0243928.1 hypothetical protein [Corynebacterium macginleyi]